MEQATHPFVQFRASHDLKAACYFNQLQASRPIVILLYRRKSRFNIFLWLIFKKFKERLDRQRFWRREHQRFNNWF
ncbi:uncharacterized protein METZ01_LOCUS17190 [marine metagenome]|uniref:Uncharacterized protein n=1 Tax=marine metagenome TaxID=408172 RepID=A0A381PBJ3_9ZZZZ